MKMTRDTPCGFHRLPLYDKKRLRLRRAALKIDPNIKELRVADYRVRSEHFDRADYLHQVASKSPKHYYLKPTAVPGVAKPAVGAELQDIWAVMDRAPGQVRSTGIQVNVPETCTAAMEKPTLQHVVDEEAILQLMRNCPMCNRKCRCSKHTRGPYFIVYQSCYFCHYQRKWASQPEARNMNTHKAHTQPKRKLQPKDKVSVNAKTRASQANKTSIAESSVSESHDPSET